MQKARTIVEDAKLIVLDYRASFCTKMDLLNEKRKMF